MTKLFSRVAVAFTLSLCCVALSSCTSRLNEQAGIEGTGDKVASRGVVTKLGSIYVNGIHFDTDMAEIYVDGQPTSEESLLQGMVVSVEGAMGASDTEAYAFEVHATYIVKGTIDAIEVDENNLLQITLPGYTVTVPEDAVFKGTNYDALSAGDVVGVSGLEINENTVYASQIIAIESGDDETSLQGTVRELTEENYQFVINDVRVDYAQANLESSAMPLLAEGQKVVIRGQMATNERLIIASEITLAFRPSYSDSIQLNQEGFVYDYDGESLFKINDIEVDVSEAEITGGSLDYLQSRVRVSVGGVYRDNVLHADYAHIILPSTLRTTGRVDDISMTWWRFTVQDIEFKVDPFTVFQDSSNIYNHYFDLRDLRVGDHIEVHARPAENGWRAMSVKRIEAEDSTPFSIKGRIVHVLPSGDFYLDDNERLFVSVANIPPYQTFPYMPGQSVFVVGDMDGQGTLVAEQIFPVISGCTTWFSEDCRPPPPPPPPPPGTFTPPTDSFNRLE